MYSLNTRDYYAAIRLYHKEMAAWGSVIDLLKVVALKISKRTYPFKVDMEDEDIDNLLVHRIGEVQKFCEDHFNEIEQCKLDFTEVRVLNGTVRDQENQAASYLLRYLYWLYLQPETHITLKNVLAKVMDGRTTIPNDTNHFRNLESVDWFKKYFNKFQQVENYNEKVIGDILSGKPSAAQYASINPLIKKLTATYQDVANKKIEKQRRIKTLWTTLYDRMVHTHNLRKPIKQTTINGKRRYLELIFTLLDKNCIDDITAEDCKRLSTDIRRVPKGWDLKSGKRLNSHLLVAGAEGTLSLKTIKSHLIAFKELLTFAVEEEIIPSNFEKNIITPIINKEPAHAGFTNTELRTIFNPHTYPNRYSCREFSRFWIPLISLFTGARLNEICQLRVQDIVKVKTISCFKFCADHPLQSLKNRHSKRFVPIHQTLIDLGFLDFVNAVKKAGVDWLFYNLPYTKKNQFAGAFSQWFGRYLTSIKIPDERKVFHSFRYTLEGQAIKAHLPTEVQNAICGWANKGIGQSLYGKNIDIRFLKREINKIKYSSLTSILNQFKLDASKKDCSVIPATIRSIANNTQKLSQRNK